MPGSRRRAAIVTRSARPLRAKTGVDNDEGRPTSPPRTPATAKDARAQRAEPTARGHARTRRPTPRRKSGTPRHGRGPESGADSAACSRTAGYAGRARPASGAASCASPARGRAVPQPARPRVGRIGHSRAWRATKRAVARGAGDQVAVLPLPRPGECPRVRRGAAEGGSAANLFAAAGTILCTRNAAQAAEYARLLSPALLAWPASGRARAASPGQRYAVG